MCAHTWLVVREWQRQRATLHKIFGFPTDKFFREPEKGNTLKPMNRKATAIFVACNALGLAAHAVAAANDPPECNDKTSLSDAKRQYQGLEEQKQNLKIKEFSDVKQIRPGPPPASVNQYANKTTYATSSRWCQATAALSNGKSDTIYWRMDYLVEGKGFAINVEHCATNHDLLDSSCQKLRAGK
ncbi:MAG: hypothetical protein ABI624_12860 [Casimicrobiaceae bacterium]